MVFGAYVFRWQLIQFNLKQKTKQNMKSEIPTSSIHTSNWNLLQCWLRSWNNLWKSEMPIVKPDRTCRMLTTMLLFDSARWFLFLFFMLLLLLGDWKWNIFLARKTCKRYSFKIDIAVSWWKPTRYHEATCVGSTSRDTTANQKTKKNDKISKILTQKRKEKSKPS